MFLPTSNSFWPVRSHIWYARKSLPDSFAIDTLILVVASGFELHVYLVHEISDSIFKMLSIY